MSKFNVGDEVEVDLFCDGVYRPARITTVGAGLHNDLYVIDVETCPVGYPDCIKTHNDYLSSDKTTRAR